MNKIAIAFAGIPMGLSTLAAAQPSEMIQNEILPMPNGDLELSYAGTSVAIEGHFAVVGRPGFSGSVDGDAIVYEYDNTLKKWVYFETLTANDSVDNEGFGESVAICDGAIIVGRPEFNYIDANGVGSAFVYLYDDTNDTWGSPTQITPVNTSDIQWFGYSVDITNDGSGSFTAVVGANQESHDGTNAPDGSSGTAHVFTYTPSSGWSSGTPFYPTAVDTRKFGTSVAVNGDYMAIGAPRSGSSTSSGGQGVSGGVVYLYDRTSGTGWSSPTILLPASITELNFFGSSIAIDDDTLVIGADGERGFDIDATAEGKVFVYTLTGTSATLDQTLFAYHGGVNDNFGTSVSVSGDVIVVGASEDLDSPSSGGSMSIFRYDNGSWTETYIASATNGEPDDFYGASVAVSGNNIITGAPELSPSSTLQFTGAAYAYKKSVCLEEIDFNDDGRVNFFDVSIFLEGFNNQDSFADINGDNEWNFFDVSLFLSMYEGDPCQ